MNLVYIFGVLILFLSKVLAEDQNVTATKETLYTLEYPGSLENETELIEIDFADNVRDKRALGIILQGLVQALGYNTTPIQIASLPNSGSMQLGPITLDLRNARVINSSPNPAPTMAAAANTPQQRETLRFTGVVNFGNGTNIADHLRRYERIFHGSTNGSTLPSPAPAAPTAAPAPPSPLPLLQPVFFPIPIPLAENLRYPKPLLSVVSTAPSATNPPNPVVDQRVPELKPQPKPTPAPESGEERPNSAESGEKDLSGNGYKKNESQELDDEREASKETEGNQVDENESSEEMMAKLKESLSSPEEYVPMIPKFSKGFGLNLPIEIKPFRGQLMNSYGQSLEHDGKIDPSVADFFAKYKNPRTGVFEPLKIEVPEDSVEKLPEKYLNKQNKYEEYDLKDEKDDEIQNVSNEDLREDNYEDDLDNEGEEEDEEEEEEGNVAAEMLRKMQNQESVRQPQQNLQNVPQYNQNLAIPQGNDARLQNVPFGGQPYNNFGNLNPYYKPVQYYYPPDSLERTAHRVASYQNDPNFVNMNQGFPPNGEAFIRANPEYLGPRIAKRIAARDQNISTNKQRGITASTIGEQKDLRREEPVVRTLSQASRKLEEKITVSRSSSPNRRDSLASTSTSSPRNASTLTSTTLSSRRTPASTSTSTSASVSSRKSSREETKRRTDRKRTSAFGSRNRNPEIVNENRDQLSVPINVKRNVDSTRSVRGRSRN